MRTRRSRGLKRRTRRLRGGAKPTVIIIGVAGGSGSGKSTYAEDLKKALEEDHSNELESRSNELESHVNIIAMDDYYKETTNKNANGRPTRMPADHNWDEPAAYDIPKLIQDLQTLKRGESIIVPTFSFVNHLVTLDPAKKITPQGDMQYIILEGLFVLHADIKPHLDYSIFLDLDLKRALERRITRNIERYKGRKTANNIKNEATKINAAYRQHIEPTKATADLVLNMDSNQQATSSSPA